MQASWLLYFLFTKSIDHVKCSFYLHSRPQCNHDGSHPMELDWTEICRPLIYPSIPSTHSPTPSSQGCCARILMLLFMQQQGFHNKNTRRPDKLSLILLLCRPFPPFNDKSTGRLRNFFFLFRNQALWPKNNSSGVKQFTMAEEKKEFLGYPSFQEFSQVGKMVQQITDIRNTVLMQLRFNIIFCFIEEMAKAGLHQFQVILSLSLKNISFDFSNTSCAMQSCAIGAKNCIIIIFPLLGRQDTFCLRIPMCII